jgi:predicted transcriptional regulator
MSKITFRADDDLVERLEAFDASKSEVMREALRTYLDDAGGEDDAGTVDDALAARVDELIAERLDARLGRGPHAFTPRPGGDLTVNVTLDGVSAEESDATARVAASDGEPRAEPTERKTEAAAADGGRGEGSTCGGCGEPVPDEHVYCPNCGEKTSHRVFCDCGDELRSDWSFCPGCGRRTPAADVLDAR